MGKPRKGWHTRKNPHDNMSPRNLEIYAKVIEGKLTYDDIGKEYDISRGRVCQLKTTVERWLRPQFSGKIDQIREYQTKLLLYVFTEAMAEWERSKLESRERYRKKGSKPDGNSSEHKEVRKEQCGDPRYLEAGMKALADIRKLWGVDAPIKTALDINSTGPVEMELVMVKNRDEALSFGKFMKQLANAPASKN